MDMTPTNKTESIMKIFDEKFPNVERWKYDSYVNVFVEILHSEIKRAVEEERERIIKKLEIYKAQKPLVRDEKGNQVFMQKTIESIAQIVLEQTFNQFISQLKDEV